MNGVLLVSGTEDKDTERTILGVRINGSGDHCDHDYNAQDYDCKEKVNSAFLLNLGRGLN